MFVVAGASGNTGSVVAEELLQRGEKVRVLARDPSKVAELAKKGAEVFVAELDDVAKMTEALKGARGAYLLLPPQMTSNDPLADNKRRAELLAKAVDASHVPHVVFLSSVAAHHASGTGPIRSTYDAEQIFGKSAASVTFVRAASFVENLGGTFYALDKGVLPTFFKADKPFAMVTTIDIGKAAADALLEASKPGEKKIIELAGARDLSPKDIAAELSAILGKPIDVQEGPEEAIVPALTGAGLNAAWAGLFKDLTVGVNNGHIAFEGGNARFVRGTTPVATVLRKLLPKTLG